MVSLDPKTEAFARDLSRLRSYLDLRKAQGRQSIVEIALESDFKKKLAELQTRLAELNRTICPDQAHRLIVSYTLEQQARAASERALPGAGSTGDFAYRWIEAWRTKRLAKVLSLFHENALYRARGEEARGEYQIRKLLGRVLHDFGDIAIHRTEFDDGKLIMHWQRSSPGRNSLSHRSSVFDGTSKVEIVGDLATSCEEDWTGYSKILRRLLFDQPRSPDSGAGTIVEYADEVIIGGIALKKRKPD